jgi:hypothetical protein
MQFRCRACDRMVETPADWVGGGFTCPLCGRSVRAASGSGPDRSAPATPAGERPEPPTTGARGGRAWLVAGTALCTVGLLMVLQSVYLAITKYDFGSVREVSTWVGGMGLSLVICAAGAWLMKRGAAHPSAGGSAGGDPSAPPRQSPLLVPMTIVLGVGAAYGLMLVAGAIIRRSRHPAASPVAPERFSGRGVAFDLPDGWLRMKPDKQKLLAWVISPGSDRRQPKAMIMVETGKPRSPDLAETAAGYAAMWGAKVLEEPTDLAGVPARRVRGKNPTPEMRPVEAVIAIRRGQIYLIMGGVTAGHSCSAEVEGIRRSWKWAD